MTNPDIYFDTHGKTIRFPASPEPQAARPSKFNWHATGETSLENRWHIKGVTPETGLAFLGAAWGVGKSFTALEICRCTMTGEPFAGQLIKRQGGVLWLAAEAGGEMEPRLKALQKDGRILDGKALPFAWTTEVPILVQSNAAEALSAIVTAARDEMQARFGVPLVLVVIDTLMAAAGFAEENSSAETQKALKPLADVAARFGLLALVVDHYGHDTTKGLRGSTNKPAFADAILGINAKRAEDGTVSDRVLTKIKVRGGREGTLARLDLRVVELGVDTDGDPVTSMVVDFHDYVPASKGKGGRKHAPTAALFFNCLDVALADHGTSVRIPNGPEVQAVNVEHLRAEYYARRTDCEAATKQKAFRRLLDSAVERREVGYAKTSAGEFLWVI